MVNFNFPKVWWWTKPIGGAIALPCPYGSYGPDPIRIMGQQLQCNMPKVRKFGRD